MSKDKWFSVRIPNHSTSLWSPTRHCLWGSFDFAAELRTVRNWKAPVEHTYFLNFISAILLACSGLDFHILLLQITLHGARHWSYRPFCFAAYSSCRVPGLTTADRPPAATGSSLFTVTTRPHVSVNLPPSQRVPRFFTRVKSGWGVKLTSI
jgi:hypothetical protein